MVSSYNSISSYTAAISHVAVDQTTVKTLNGFGQLKTSTDANSKSTSYIYGAFGKLLSVTDMNGVVISNEFDDYARRTQLNDPDKGIINYVYNGLQQLVERTAPGGVVQTHYFDGAGREVQLHTTSLNQ